MKLKLIPLLSLLSLALGLSAGRLSASPIFEADFNNPSGIQSLANTGTAGGTGNLNDWASPAYTNQASLTQSSVPSVNQANGYALDTTLTSNNTLSSGNSSWADFGDVSGIGGASQLTLTMWINPSALGINQYLFDKSSAGVNAGSRGITFRLNSSNSLNLFVNGTSLSLGPGSGSITTDQWIFVAVTYDGTKTSANTQLFVGNGASFTFTSALATLNGGSVGTTTNPLLLGNVYNSVNPTTHDGRFNFRGLTDDVRFYDTILDSNQINTVMQYNDASIPEPRTTAFLISGIALAGLLRKTRRAQ